MMIGVNERESTPGFKQPLGFRLPAQRAAIIVRELARETRNVAWSIHALERMLEREITDEIALDVLRNGHPIGDVELGRNPGEWKLKIAKPIKGRRHVGVVAVVIRDRRLLVKTVEWEDSNGR